MFLLRRISDGLWSNVSPGRTDTPRSAPVMKKTAVPTSRRASIHNLAGNARSMSPTERVGNWRVPSPSSQATSSSVKKSKRKRLDSETPSAGRYAKKHRMDDDEMYYDYETVEDDGYTAYNDYENTNATGTSRVRRNGTNSTSPEPDMSMYAGSDDIADLNPRRIVDLPADRTYFSDDELRNQGWDDDYITVFQKIGRRGQEPLLPSFLKFNFRYLPAALFEADDDAFVGPVRNEHYKAGKALELLFELGGRVRDRIDFPCAISPEQQVVRQIKAFNKWVQTDAGLDRRTAIPVLALEFRPAGTDIGIMIDNATKKCRRLADRYREALRIQHSVEFSPKGSDGTMLSYPLPTFYAIIGSQTKLAVMAYDPKKDPEAECAPIAYFDLDELDYDIWNSLALAIVVCHARNVQMVIAEDTGVGLKQPGMETDEMEVDDPDA